MLGTGALGRPEGWTELSPGSWPLTAYGSEAALCREKVNQPLSSPGWVCDGGDGGGDTPTWEGLMVV